MKDHEEIAVKGPFSINRMLLYLHYYNNSEEVLADNRPCHIGLHVRALHLTNVIMILSRVMNKKC